MEDVLGPGNLMDVLLSMNATGGFLVTVLTDAEGLVIASAPAPGWDADKQAAVVALIQRAARQSQIVSLESMDEICIRDVNGRRLICRPFEVDGKTLLLSVLVDEGKPYRRLTSAALRDVRRAWAI
jgi:predicted regulator of Ras-like GTPase activity (Roadblock/LC7/MglB family)